jgi:beta-galactosidase/beta-glucuronidase
MMQIHHTSREKHPRPDFMRDTLMLLDGEWQFAFDDDDAGLREGWQRAGYTFPTSITVPFCYQSEMSGIGGDDIHPLLWYRREFKVPEDMRGGRILLHFGAVDYACRVYVNGQAVGSHVGGYTPFALDITWALADGENDLCLRVEDRPDCTQPRGKQYWQRGLMGCWYTPTSGIWQSVYLEAVGDIALERVHITPDIDRHQATVEIAVDRIPDGPVRIELELQDGASPRRFAAEAEGRIIRLPLDMQEDGEIGGMRLWSPEQPHLYDLSVRLLRGTETLDHVRTYFGMRKIEVKDGHILLNNEPYYQRLILDQGYWPQSLLTPPSGDALRADVEWTKKFGYNGARKHQKVEDPRYYYWADRLGLLVWGEVPSAYVFSHESASNLADTLAEFIRRDFNHPCIVAWVPLNESWGVPRIYADKQQQALARTLYHLCKALDGTRLVSSNDGWEQVITDIFALHDYTASGEDLALHFANREKLETVGCDRRMPYADGEALTGKEAFMVTEYGGIAFDSLGAQERMGGMETWGYNGKVSDEESFLKRFASATDAIRAIPFCRGYCYTQLTDVQQEINGLLTPDRQPKVDPTRFSALNCNPKGQ